MKPAGLAVLFALLVFSQAPVLGAAAGELTRTAEIDALTGGARAVAVTRGVLVHTTQLTSDLSGAAGLHEVLDKLRSLAGGNDGLRQTIKLNLYLADPADMGVVKKLVAEYWPEEGVRPAITVLPGALPENKAVACDAVYTGGVEVRRGNAKSREIRPAPPKREILYVSGRAASGELGEAASGTMRELFSVLEHCGSSPSQVIQVKAFLQPVERAQELIDAIKASFGEAPVPPLVCVEWTSPSRATEIELIATGPRNGGNADSTETVSYETPPGDKPSPVYSRVALVRGGTLIYTSGLAMADEDQVQAAGFGDAQVRSVFAQLKGLTESLGSDSRHLAKATYYVSDEEVSKALNDLRPQFYDPERPPAASKVSVRDLGQGNKTLLIDMIAVGAGE